MTTAIATATGGIDEFKSGVDALLEKRRYFIEKVLPTLIPGKDYFIIKGHKSLGKAGAEKLASLYQLVAIFEKDTETMESLSGIGGLIAYKCTLSRGGITVAEGRGAAVLKEHNENPNTTIKICEKRGFVSAIIRATGLSDLFSQDLEDLSESAIQPSIAVADSPTDERDDMSNADDPYYPYEPAENEEEESTEAVPITEPQRKFLYDLAQQNLDDGAEKEQYLANIDSLTKADASEAIGHMLALSAR